MDSKKYTLRDLIYILLIIVSGLANYFVTQSTADEALSIAKQNKQELKDNNLELLGYKIDEVLSLIKEIKSKQQ